MRLTNEPALVALLRNYETRVCICTCNENWRCTQA